MKLLFDHNLSHKLVRRLDDVFPGSTQTRLLGYARAVDPEIWFHARTHDFVIVTKDNDFAELAVLRGAPRRRWCGCVSATAVALPSSNCCAGTRKRLRTCLPMRSAWYWSCSTNSCTNPAAPVRLRESVPARAANVCSPCTPASAWQESRRRARRWWKMGPPRSVEALS